MINIIYAALPTHAQTEKTTFSCKDDCTLTKHTRCLTYSACSIFSNMRLFHKNETKRRSVFRRRSPRRPRSHLGVQSQFSAYFNILANLLEFIIIPSIQKLNKLVQVIAFKISSWTNFLFTSAVKWLNLRWKVGSFL